MSLGGRIDKGNLRGYAPDDDINSFDDGINTTSIDADKSEFPQRDSISKTSMFDVCAERNIASNILQRNGADFNLNSPPPAKKPRLDEPVVAAVSAVAPPTTSSAEPAAVRPSASITTFPILQYL